MPILLGNIPEEWREKWGERGTLLLLQLYGGVSAILINKNDEAVAMDIILKVDYSTSDDIKFAVSCGIDTNKQTYSFKAKVIQLALLVVWNCDTSIRPTKKTSGTFRTSGPNVPFERTRREYSTLRLR